MLSGKLRSSVEKPWSLPRPVEAAGVKTDNDMISDAVSMASEFVADISSVGREIMSRSIENSAYGPTFVSAVLGFVFLTYFSFAVVAMAVVTLVSGMLTLLAVLAVKPHPATIPQRPRPMSILVPKPLQSWH